MNNENAPYDMKNKMQYMASGSKHIASMSNDIIYQCVIGTREPLPKAYANAWPFNILVIIIP